MLDDPGVEVLTNASEREFVSPATRLVAEVWKATYRPSALMDTDSPASMSAWTPLPSLETRTVVPVSRSRRNTCTPVVAGETRLVAAEAKAT